MQYIYEYDIAAVFIILAVMINFYRKKTLSTRITVIFNVLLLVEGIAAAFDALGSFVIMNPTKFPLWVNYFFLIVFYLTYTAIPLIYFMSLLFSTDFYRKNKLLQRLFIIPYAVEFLLIIFTPLFNTVTYFDADLNYHRGFFYSLLYVISAIYLIASVYVSKVFGKSFSENQKRAVTFYTIACMVGVAIQAIISNLMIVCFLSSISALIIYLSLENPANFVDKEMDIFNRTALTYTVQQNIESKKEFSIIAIQIVGLNYLNDLLGSKAKTQVIHHISDLLQMIHKKRSIFRYSSNRFVILIKKDETKKNSIIENLQLAFDEPFRIADSTIPLTLKITHFDCPSDASNIENIMDLIDFSLTDITEKDSSIVSKADTNLLQKRRRENYLINTLKKACETNDFEVFYQPIYSISDNKIVAIDTKIFFKNPELKTVTSKEFIPLAEKQGLILQIENFILDSVFDFIAKYNIQEKGIETVYLNLSAIQCMQEQLAINILNKLNKRNIDPKLINLTITDDTVINSNPLLYSSMEKLIQKNINFSLGNFGSGFSNTYSLIKYPFTTVKLNKEIVSSIQYDSKSLNTFKHLINMIKALDMKIIISGIETESQFNISKQFECDYIKGNYYSRPLTEDGLISLLEEI